jgi:LuxR family maltose regulon positive regulatory protein
VSRPRLLARLDQAADLPLTLLCAGPGTGKTALLSDWAKQAKAQVAWFSPAAADADTGQFWQLLSSALPDRNGSAIARLAGAAPVSGQELLHMLSSRVPEGHAPLVVIIDDAHVMSHPGVLDSLDSMIRSPQPRVRLVLAARSDPQLPLHKYRLAGQLVELRAGDLALSQAETRAVFALHGVSLADADLSALATRTEGWAAGVRLSAMRMEGTGHPPGLASQLAMDSGSIGEYFMDEVLRPLSGECRRLLVETSFLPEVTGSLAYAVTGIPGSGEMLADLARRNSFVVPLDSMQSRYRYHRLFGLVLSYLLQRREGQAVRCLQQRAADWFEANGDLGGAVYWAVQAGNGSHAAVLLARNGLAHAFVRRLDLSGIGLDSLLPLTSPRDVARSGTVPRSAGTAPETGWTVPQSAGSVPESRHRTAANSMETAVAGVVVAAINASQEGAAFELRRLRAVRHALNVADHGLAATLDLSELILGQKALDAGAIDAAALRLLGGEAGGMSPALVPGLPAAVLLARASAHFWHGRHDDVATLLDMALDKARRDRLASLELEVLAMMSLTDSIRSRMGCADQASRQARALQQTAGLATPPALELATAICAYVGGDFAGHARALQQVALPGTVSADPGLAATLMLGQAEALLARGEAAEAHALLLQQASRPIPPVLAVRRDVMIADLDTCLGRPRSALGLLDCYQGTKFAVLTANARARAHLALGDLRQARDCVRSVLTTPSAQVRRLDFVVALLCDASIAIASGERGRAVEVLSQAIEAAQGEIVLPFLRAADTFAGLLTRHPDVASRWPAPLSPAPVTPAGLAPAVPAPRPPRDLADPLTQRELTILRLLSTNLSTAEIAAKLCLSANTVKTHLAAIYRKLSASRRREAVVRARELELI